MIWITSRIKMNGKWNPGKWIDNENPYNKYGPWMQNALHSLHCCSVDSFMISIFFYEIPFIIFDIFMWNAILLRSPPSVHYLLQWLLVENRPQILIFFIGYEFYWNGLLAAWSCMLRSVCVSLCVCVGDDNLILRFISFAME